MTTITIARQRLLNQRIAEPSCARAADVVQWLGAVQAQDYAAAKWAVALRMPNATEADVERAFDDGDILRTHIMRPTWHFVSPADLRWLLALTAPRVNAACAYYFRSSGLDDSIFTRSNAMLTHTLQGGKQLTRQELVSALQHAGIANDHLLRSTYLIMRAELDGIICSGPGRGNQFTYALLDERVPPTSTLERDQALAELTGRYFRSHGPATVQDFIWWSGLTTADAKAGLAMITSQLIHEEIDGHTYWFSAATPPATDLSQTVYLLPNFDEYMVGYTDRSAIFDPAHAHYLDSRSSSLLTHTIVLDGQIVGVWKRALKKDSVILTPTLFTPLNANTTRALAAAADRYATFLSKSLAITLPEATAFP